MKTPLRSHRRCSDGMTLLLVISVITFLMVCLGAALEYTSTIRKQANRSQLRQMAIGAADGALEITYANWREICRDIGSGGAPTVANISGLASKTLSASYYTGIANLSGTYGLKAVDPRLNPTAYPVTSGTPPPAYGTDAVMANSGGSTTTYTTSYYYLASATVNVGPTSKRQTINASRVFELQKTSPWQWAIFYNDDLELHPGATMYVDGWVHSNGDIYTAHNTLNFQSKVTYGGGWKKQLYDPRETGHLGDVHQDPYYDTTLPPAQTQAYQPFGIDPSTFNSSNVNNTGYHELIEPPNTSTSDPMASQRYYTQAGIKVMINSTSDVKIYNAAGTQVTASSTGANKMIYDAVSSSISVQGSSFQDNREAATMTVTDVDVSKITAAVAATGTNFFSPKVLYITDASGSVSTKRGVRLKNGGTLPSGGLTVVSANPVYIQGDYNTGSTSATYSSGAQPDSNSPSSAWSGDGASTSSSNAVTGYDLQSRPAAVIADAVNVLSNSWQDSLSSSGVNSRAAANTTINSAIVSGIASSSTAYTGANSYSGGAENFPRFHENWAGKNITYYGSMVELYESKQATGRWGNNNVYSAPNRRWKFNRFFRTNPPPGTTLLINYNRGQWFVQ